MKHSLFVVGFLMFWGAFSSFPLVQAIEQNAVQGKLFEEELEAFLEKLKALMTEGIPSLGIPVLEPFETEKAQMKFEFPGVIDFDGTFENLKVVGMQDFITNKASMTTSLLTSTMTFNLTMPKLTITTNPYKLYADVILFVLDGAGKGELILEDLTIYIFMKLRIKGGYLVPESVDFEMNLKKAKANFTGLVDTEEGDHVMNEILSDLIPDLIEHEKELIAKIVGEVILDTAKNMLEGVTLLEIINIITGQKPFP